MSKPVVAICTPIYDSLEPAFWRSHRQLHKPSSVDVVFQGGITHILDTEGLLVEDARRVMTKGALAAEGDVRVSHILMIDADMTFPPDALKQLLDHDVPIVGGLCFNRRSPYQPILCRYHPASKEFGEQRYGFCYHYPPAALFEVDATGAAFLLVKREVFDAISLAEGPEKWWERVEGLSEDFSFCLRAKRAGYKIHVDTGLKIGHIAKVVVDEAFARKNRPYEWEAWNPDAYAAAPGQPLASVVIPTYNQNPRFLKAAVLSAAGQTVPVEVIIVDDGSTPAVPETDWPANVRVMRHSTNRGIAAALNTGILAMTTDWFAWLSSDDLFDPRKLQLQLAACVQARMKASYTRWQSIGAKDGDFASVAAYGAWKTIAEQMNYLAQVCAVNGSTVLLHKDVFDEIGLFDPSYTYGQDWDMWARVGEKFFWYGIDEVLTTRREHGNLTAAIAAEPDDGPRRQLRDWEDAEIRGRFEQWVK